MRFENPTNGYTESVGSLTFLWVLLFGAIYFAVKGVWNHFIASILFACVTLGISWFIYPFFSYEIMRKHYLKKGWVQVE